MPKEEQVKKLSLELEHGGHLTVHHSKEDVTEPMVIELKYPSHHMETLGYFTQANLEKLRDFLNNLP